MLGDIRQLIAEYCILPLGNQVLREFTPLVRSVLIAGPHGSGKKLLVNAICTELGATLFDITPANIAGKYPGKSGLIMLVHLISKVCTEGNLLVIVVCMPIVIISRIYNIKY